ncbi:MAG: hypothetical protein RR053_06780 [Evtepia sp.]
MNDKTDILEKEKIEKKPWLITTRIAKLIDVKSIVTLCMTACMAGLLFGAFQPTQDALALFCTSYGAIVTYFFTRKEG